MADENLLKRVHNLSDLELAALLCLVAREHCLISTHPDAVEELVEELKLISTKTFALRAVVVNCHAHMTLDDFATALLVTATSPVSVSPTTASQFRTNRSPKADSSSYFHSQPGSGHGGSQHNAQQQPPHVYSPLLSPSTSTAGGIGVTRIADVVLARDLDRAPKAVQIQALELLRTKRIFTRTAVQAAPKQFLFVAVVGAQSGGEARVTQHLNDFFFVSHWHDAEDDGFPLLEEAEDDDEGGEDKADDDDYGADGRLSRGGADDNASTTSSESVVKAFTRRLSNFGNGHGLKAEPRGKPVPQIDPLFSEGDISTLARLSQQVHVDIDVVRYQMNVVSFLRMHRAVAPGSITPTATKQFGHLIRCLAPLHGLDYVTPALVGLAARKIYLHRIQIVEPARERSMQWGSELGAVEAILDGVGPEDVIEDVLGMVGAPL